MGDILKVDIGVHVKGRILDSAFTLSWAPNYNNLIEAVKAATNTGIRVSHRALRAQFHSLTCCPTGSGYRRPIR
jgi:methionine aminopeptidase